MTKFFRGLFDEQNADGTQDPNGTQGNDGADSNPNPANTNNTDDAIAQAVEAEKEKHRQTLNELESLKKISNLTATQREDLDAKLAKTRNDLMSEKQRSESERKRLLNEHKTALENMSKKADKFEKLYKTSTIQRSLTDAAVEHEAFAPAQVVSMLERDTKMIEEEIDGQATGRLIPKVEMLVEIEGQTKNVSLNPTDAVRTLSEKPEFFNLFKPTLKSGPGRSGSGQGGDGELTAQQAAAKGPEAYREWRAKNLKR